MGREHRFLDAQRQEAALPRTSASPLDLAQRPHRRQSPLPPAGGAGGCAGLPVASAGASADRAGWRLLAGRPAGRAGGCAGLPVATAGTSADRAPVLDL